MSEKDKPFTVNDRRHFTPDGRAREEQPDVPEAGQASAEAPPPAHGRSGEPPPPTGEPPHGQAGERPPRRPGSTGALAPVDFASFVLSLGAQAGMMLGAEPGADGAAEALEGARQLISILEMLQGKTEGRRSEEESRILEDLLFQLRLAYVERVKRS